VTFVPNRTSEVRQQVRSTLTFYRPFKMRIVTLLASRRRIPRFSSPLRKEPFYLAGAPASSVYDWQGCSAEWPPSTRLFEGDFQAFLSFVFLFLSSGQEAPDLSLFSGRLPFSGATRLFLRSFPQNEATYPSIEPAGNPIKKKFEFSFSEPKGFFSPLRQVPGLFGKPEVSDSRVVDRERASQKFPESGVGLR